MRLALRVLLRALVGLGAVLLIAAFAGLLYRAIRQHENAASVAIRTPRGIDQERFVRIGGIDQWVVIRGEDRANPILLYVDGGPGGSLSPFNVFTHWGWEKPFTVVEWDQRGAGKTRTRSGPVTPGTTIERMAQDGIDVAQYALARLHQRKLILVGASWGSALGVMMVRARPDLFYAYVGTGQVSDIARGERLGYERVLAKARARHDDKACAQLLALGPPPYHRIEAYYAERQWINGYDSGGPNSGSLVQALLFAPRYSLHDDYSWIQGFLEETRYFVGPTVDAPFERLDFFASARDFKVPVFVIQGADDDTEPAEVAKDYVAAIRAPQKMFIAVPGAGHSVSVAEGDKFLDDLVRYVRPLAIADSQGLGEATVDVAR